MIVVEKKKRIDNVLLACVFMLVIIGTFSIFSSTTMLDFRERIIRTHIIAVICGIFIMLFMWILDYQILEEYAGKVYIFSLFLLFLVLLFGVADKGSKSWFRLPFFSFQPSEVARVALIIYIANYLSKNKNSLNDIYGIVKIFIISSPFFMLMAKQPDFSGILITFFPLLVMVIIAGIDFMYLYIFIFYLLILMIVPTVSVMVKFNPNYLENRLIEFIYESDYLTVLYVSLVLGIIMFFIYIFIKKLNPTVESLYFLIVYFILVGGYISGVFVKNQIKDYQYKRIESFLNPYTDPRGSGYNIIQARVALGSGGFKGKGIFSGTQSRLGFIPERHTDFIFSVVGEEMGFIGSIIVVVSYIIMLYRMKSIALLSRTDFGYYVSLGFAGLFMGYFFINIGMILGFFPIAGVPLAFVSYGGSNMVSSFIMIGILQSIYTRRLSIT